jgi:hypothetical protein
MAGGRVVNLARFGMEAAGQLADAGLCRAADDAAKVRKTVGAFKTYQSDMI